MLGAIIGDIVGSIYEFDNIHTTDFPFLGKYNHFTDDTVMTMAVAEWLLTDPERTEEKLTDCLVRWGQRFPDAGYGGAFRVWLFHPEDLHTYRDTDSRCSQPDPLSRLLEEVRRQYRKDNGLPDEHPTSGGRRPYNSYGNGSAMRVAACGWVAQSLDEALDLAERSAEVTHNHREGILGAQAVAAAIYLFRQHATKNEVKEYLSHGFGYNQLDATCDQLRPARFDESCHSTIPLAFAALMDSTDFESAIRLAVSLGGDTDTIACITGAMAEPLYGIPNTIQRAILPYLNSDFLPIISAIRKNKIDDPYNLQRFISAQEGIYPTALQEMIDGRKRTHWMWFIFPQAKGLGHSKMSQFYAISSLAEAKAYLAHPVLGTRLKEITLEVLRHSDLGTHNATTAYDIFGRIDRQKFQSCMTLFDLVDPSDMFRTALDYFFHGHSDQNTINKMKK